MKQSTLNLRGRIFDLQTPQVMGIMNITPDSFYKGSRLEGEQAIRIRAEEIVSEGASLIDVGAYSSRPSGIDISPQEEMARLRPALKILRDEFGNVPVSVDTFRSNVARMCVEEYGVSIINDISGGDLDPNMFAVVASLGVPYILMHMRGTPQEMQQYCEYEDLVSEVVDHMHQRVDRLRQLGQTDIILDPGYGFSKTTAQNYQLMAAQAKAFSLFELPLLVGISRKSMIYRLVGGSPTDALNGTTVLNTFALMNHADILRVHDVREAVEAVAITSELKKYQID